MICLALGMGILGFAALRHARHCHRGAWGHHGGSGTWGGCGNWYAGWHRNWHGPRGGRYGSGWHHGGPGRAGLYMMLSRLDASPAQERAIVAEADKLHERLHAARAGLGDARGDLAAAVRGPSLDDAALGAVLGRVDTATGEARTAMLEALRNVHAVLDERQRELLAEWLDAGWWRRGGSPYRV